METREEVQVELEEIRAAYHAGVQARIELLASEANNRQITHAVVDTQRPYLQAIEAYLGFRGKRSEGKAMVSFASAGLFGVLAAALALPLVIHLLNKSFPRFLRFPSIELIKRTMARRSRLYRWRHLILLLLRTAFLALLLLAFLRPVLKRFGADTAARGGRRVLIVLDHSLSMEHRGDGPTSRERAAHEGLKLIDSLGAEDAVNILLMDTSPTTCFVDFSRDHAEAKRFLGRLKPGLGRGDVNLANTWAGRLTAKGGGPRPEIYYISDFQRKNWANASFTALPAGARLLFVDVGPAHRDNWAILDARVSQSHVLAGDTVLLEVTVGNFGAREL